MEILKKSKNILKIVFKWGILTVFALLMAVLVQVPSVLDTPLFEFKSQSQFNRAMQHINITNNVLLIILFTVIDFILEWFLCKWVGNRLKFSKALTLKNSTIAIIAGLVSLAVAVITTLPSTSNSSSPGIMEETLKTNLAIPLIITVSFIAPTLEEMLFRGAIQKGFFKKLSPWLSIVLTSLIFAAFHNITLDLYFLSKFISGILFGWVYQKTDDIKMSILAHSVNNLCAIVITLL